MTPESILDEQKRSIGKLCQNARIMMKKWTIYQAEKATGMQGVQIKAIETGGSDYTIGSLLKYTNALGITIDLRTSTEMSLD